MRKLCLAMVLQGLLSTAVLAHEFWIPAPSSVLPADGTFAPEVRIGEALVGQRYPFEPRAYETARWIGPDGEVALHTRPIARRDAPLRALGSGLHVLAVSSFGRRHTYDDPAKFLRFADEIGAEIDRLLRPSRSDIEEPITETYRRLSKALVHFENASGQDRRVGLAREWVKTPNGFQLFSGAGVAAGQLAFAFCRGPDGLLFQHQGRTDAYGFYRIALPDAQTCIVNSVFLEPSGEAWKSDWVSLSFSTE